MNDKQDRGQEHVHPGYHTKLWDNAIMEVEVQPVKILSKLIP